MRQAILDMEFEDQVADLIINGDLCFNISSQYQKRTKQTSLIIKRFFLILFNYISISGRRKIPVGYH